MCMFISDNQNAYSYHNKVSGVLTITYPPFFLSSLASPLLIVVCTCSMSAVSF